MKKLILIISTLISIIVGVSVVLTNSWDLLEPLIALGTLGFSFGTYFQTKKKTIQNFDNFDGSWIILVQEDSDIVKETKDTFLGIDCIIDFRINEDFDSLKEEIQNAIETGQEKSKAIKIVIQSKSSTFQLKIGQYIGLNVVCDIYLFNDNNFIEI